MTGSLLIVDDEQSMCDMLAADLKSRGFDVDCHTSPDAALAAFHQGMYQAVLTDLHMPGVDGIELCTQIVANRPDVPVVVMTAFGSMETAIAAIRAGAYDFVTKPVELDLLEMTLERALWHHELQDRVRVLSATVEQSQRFDDILGASPPMQKLFDQLSRVSDSEASVLITGESGTGKELIARAIHRKSRRADGPFVAINCAALPETLLESELFGHAKGAFTDARFERKGLFQQAEGGTLFLDEIGDFPLSLQAKLLRAMEQRTVRPVGGNTEVPYDARLLTATNRDLESAVEDGTFREDFYFRINVIQLESPPLRARGSDVLLIAQSYIEQFAAQSQKAIVGLNEPVAEKLLAYSWPGNVRELRNVIERAVALTRYDRIAVEDLPEKIRDYRTSTLRIDTGDPAELAPLEEVERRYILQVVEAVGGNKTQAAKILGLDRKTLYRKLKEFDDESTVSDG